MSNPIVFVAPYTTNRECYHNAECHKTQEHYSEYPKDRAERAGLKPCSYCVGELDHSERDTGDKSYYYWALENE